MHYVTIYAVNADLIGSKESCTILGIDKATLSRWVNAGHITAAHKLPGRNGAYLFTRQSIEALATQRKSA
jgi:predicted site-specific integrase-resolvase